MSSTVSKRNMLKNAYFSLPFEKDGDLIQFELNVENFIVTDEPLKPIHNDVTQTEQLELHNMFPIKPTITLTQENIYDLKNKYRK